MAGLLLLKLIPPAIRLEQPPVGYTAQRCDAGPKAAVQVHVAAAHPARVPLSGGATDGISPPNAGAPAASNLVPGDVIGLGVERWRKHQFAFRQKTKSIA